MASASPAGRAGVDASVHGIAGALAAQVSTLALYPVDQVRFLLQIQARPQDSGADLPHGERRWHCGETAALIFELATRQGVHVLYRGIGPVLLTISVSQGIYFWVYEGASPALLALPLPAVLRQLVRSLLAAILTVLLTNPLWVATMRLKVPLTKGKSFLEEELEHTRRDRGWLSFMVVFKLMAEIKEAEGTGALWQGLGSSLWLAFSPALQFLVYEGLRALELSGRQAQHPSSAEAFVMGAVSKGCALVATYPLQVAQSNLRLVGQAQRGTLEVLARLRRERGLSGLYAGFEAKLLQTALNGALMMLMYEKLVEGVVAMRT
mmetsp:Transcript_93570/g.260529  ORF Transcript_93570/g.260529 Transcript_93570/m.260529 type:complete len:322 (-) Transcript_93570:84-1049(-)